MEILSEKEEKVIKWDIELPEDEERLLVHYAIDNMSKNVWKNFRIEWALIDIIKKQLWKEDNKYGKS